MEAIFKIFTLKERNNNEKNDSLMYGGCSDAFHDSLQLWFERAKHRDDRTCGIFPDRDNRSRDKSGDGRNGNNGSRDDGFRRKRGGRDHILACNERRE